MAIKSSGKTSRIGMAAVVAGVLVVMGLIAVVVSTGMQTVQGGANPTVAAADQATSARTEAKTGEGDARAENFVGQ
jgi:hypothetical protein